MRIFTRILAAFALVLALGGAATAQGLSPEQQQALSDRVASFDTAMKANDMKSVMGVVPPKVLDKIAADRQAPSRRQAAPQRSAPAKASR